MKIKQITYDVFRIKFKFNCHAMIRTSHVAICFLRFSKLTQC